MFLRECDNCGGAEERLFVDSWTGLELCLSCLHPIVGQITMAPYTESDNLPALLKDADE